MTRTGCALLLSALAIVAATLPRPGSADGLPAFVIAFGPDFGVGSARAWDQGHASFEYRSGRRIWHELRPIYAFSVSRDGAILGTAGVHAVFRLGAVEVTPHFGIGLWQDGRGGFDSKELIQFRTGIDAFVPLSPTVSVGLGVYHVSNAGITNRSANQDVVRLALLWRH